MKRVTKRVVNWRPWLAASATMACAVLWAGASPCAAARDVVVGSKAFTEGYLLGEIAAQTIERSGAGVEVQRKLGMGGTGILYEALRSGAIDIYPDYTGTAAEAILKHPELKRAEDIRRELQHQGLEMSAPLGFDNTYALAVKEEYAAEHGLHRVSDLRSLTGEIRSAFSYEFMDRRDGFGGIAEKYGLKFAVPPRRMEHSLAYEAIAQGAVDLIEVYSTDAKIRKLGLRVLTDDLGYFPSYEGVFLATHAFVSEHPQAWAALNGLAGRLTGPAMLQLNVRADLDKVSFAAAASGFLGGATVAGDSLLSRVLARTREHLVLVGIALLFSVLVGVPLGIVAARMPLAGQAILLLSGLVQTIPSLALLCFLIPLLGVGFFPAIAALCLYGLLPVVLNTFVGLRGIDPQHREVARALGLSDWQVLTRISLPLASPAILAGIKNSVIVSIGTATLAALIGAGGYGAPIVSGLALNDIPTILTGAIPAAVMALLAYALFEAVGRVVVPKGIRL